MSIEDVDYLKANCKKQNYIFLIDSKDRDKAVYPTPAEYVTTFESPFRNVVGLEILDGSIPRTMYNIDIHNNNISFFIHDTSYVSSNLRTSYFTTSNIPTGDYTIQTLLTSLNDANLSMHINGDPTLPVVTISAYAVSTPPDVKNLIKFTCPYPFILDMANSTMAEALGFDEYPQASENLVPIGTRRYNTLTVPMSDDAKRLMSGKITVADFMKELTSRGYSADQSKAYLAKVQAEMANVGSIGINAQLFDSVDIDPSIELGVTRTLFDGPRGILLSTTKIAQSFVVATPCYLSQISIAFAGGTLAYWEIRSGTNINTSTLVTSGTMNIDSYDGSYSVITTNIKLGTMDNVTTYWLVVQESTMTNTNNTNNTTTKPFSIYYNDIQNTGITFPNTNVLMYVSTPSVPAWHSIDITGVQYNLSANLVAKDQYHTVIAPGIFNLVGERYVVLRCTEIEDASLHSLSYMKHSLGLAKFRLGVVGYSENRLDFSSIPNREFHPIGKLAKLSFRFERSNGDLYDFKGVNHSLTVAIHYYEPIQKGEFKPLINPSYVGNFLEYRRHEEDQEGDSDDDNDDDENDDNEIDNRDRVENWKYNEMRFLNQINSGIS